MASERVRVELLCRRPGCREPFAVLEDGVLVIRSRHHGRVHVNRVAVEIQGEAAVKVEKQGG